MITRRLLFLIFVINILGTIFGFIYYQYLFKVVPEKYWIFVPDSPLSTLLFASAILLILFGRKSDFLSFIGSASVIKYGLWTMFVIVYFPDHFLAPGQKEFYYLMFFLHFGMVVQPVILLNTIEYRKHYLIFTLLWFLTNDYFDYVIGIGPLSTHGLSLNVVGDVTVVLSFVSVLGAYWLGRIFKVKSGEWSLF